MCIVVMIIHFVSRSSRQSHSFQSQLTEILWLEFKTDKMPMNVSSRNLTAEVPKGKKKVSITITEISWDDGKVNTFDFDAVANLKAAMDKAANDDNVNAVVMAGSEKIFSAGFDLKIMRSAKVGELTCTGFDMLEVLFKYPKPVVFAIRGHCMALGGMMMCCSDYNVGADALPYIV